MARLLWRRRFARRYFAGLFAGEVGSPRLVKLFERFGIKRTWFIPGHSVETFPEQMQAVADAGHEIGIHGYTHENPIDMTREQETEVLDKCIELVTKLSGKRPTGYVAPWWEFSNVTNELLRPTPSSIGFRTRTTGARF